MVSKRKKQVLVLETHLDQKLTSRRSQLSFLQAFFQNFPDLDLIAKEVHSRADLKKFLDEARRNKRVKIVHLISHGETTRSRSSIVLTRNESIDLRRKENQGLFRELNAEVLFLSCCQLGRDGELMNKLAKVSGVDAIFSYTDDVEDYQAFLVESLFYHLAYGFIRGRRSNLDFKEVYERLKFALEILAIDKLKDSLGEPLLALDFG
jgi:CHAT domain